MIETAKKAEKGDKSYKNDLKEIEKRHIEATKKLTKNPYKMIICDNGSKKKDIKKLKCIEKSNSNIEVIYRKQTSAGSFGHAQALDILIEKVTTPYFVVMDADAVFLLRDWDEKMLSQINDEVKAIGTPPVTSKKIIKYRDFPIMFATLYDTYTYKNLKVSFMPDEKNFNTGMDTGYEISERFIANGKRGICFEEKSTRIYKDGPYAGVICAEYYSNRELIASHFGRGASLGNAKYLKKFRVPLIGKLLRTIIGKYQKDKWIRISMETINKN